MNDSPPNPSLNSTDQLAKAVLRFAVESWRFRRVLDRVLAKLDAGEQSRFHNQFRWHFKQLDELLAEAGLTIVNVEGHAFDPGVAATALNIDEFKTGDLLVVDQMIEPIIMKNETVVKAGTVILRKAAL